MRAVYLEETFSMGAEVELPKETSHHLINVLRIKENTSLLLLNGKGKVSKALVQSASKRKVKVLIESIREENLKTDLEIAVGLVKKDALELVLRQVAELGVKKVYLLETKYSQRYKLNLERVKKILISGIEQSNNPYLPELELISIDDLSYEAYDNVILYSSVHQTKEKGLRGSKDLIVIGPEGGFSSEEEDFFNNLDNALIYKLETYILRTSTAVATCVGHYLGLKA